MKTKKSTRNLLLLAGALLAAGSMQAQTTTPAAAPAASTDAPMPSAKVLNDNAISGITDGMGSSQGKGGFWGYAFGDYAFVGKGDSAGRGTKQQYKTLGQAGTATNQNAFEIRRAYLGFDYNINKKFSGTALLAYEGDQDVSDNRTVYLKYAYFKWKGIFKGSDLKIGQQATNSFADAYNTEPLIEYRSVEKTILDMHGVDGSSDMGITLAGKIYTFKNPDSTKQKAFIGYSAMMGDNSGNNPVAAFTGAATSLSGATITSTSTSTSTTTGGATTTTTTATTTALALNANNSTTQVAKKFRGHVFFNGLNGALTVGLYGDYLNYGNFYYNKTSKAYDHAISTFKAYADYKQKWFSVGVEWFTQSYTNGEVETTYATPKNTVDTTTAKQTGISIFARGTIIPRVLNVFVRYDSYTADNNYSFSPETGSTLKVNGTPVAETFTEAFSNTSATTPYKETFINAGLDWSPKISNTKVHIMPNIWYYGIKNAYGSGQLASANYMLYRVTFLYAF